MSLEDENFAGYWLNKGAVTERERIIALLESEMDNVSELPGALGETLSDHIFELIALIKGENNV